MPARQTDKRKWLIRSGSALSEVAARFKVAFVLPDMVMDDLIAGRGNGELDGMAFENVDEYLAAQPTEAREKLALVRAAIKRAVPGTVEAISYQIPAFRIAGRVFIFFAGWKNHYSLYPVGDALLEVLGAELGRYEISKGTIRFPLDEPVPEDLIFRIAKFKAEETLARTPLKKT